MSSSKRLFLNIDINSVTTPFLNSVAELESPTKEDLYPFVDIYADTQITDVLFNNFCQFSLTPSKVFSSSSDIYLRTVENGIPVDHKDRHKGIHKLLTEYGLDAYGIWIDRCRQVGLKPWMTVRMNDCHCPDEETCFLRSDFFYEAKEKGYNIGSKYGYYRYCFDYSYPEVRQKMLDYMSVNPPKNTVVSSWSASLPIYLVNISAFIVSPIFISAPSSTASTFRTISFSFCGSLPSTTFML